MRIKFLVLLAIFCLSAHAEKVVEVTQTGSEKFASGGEASTKQEGNVKIDSASAWAKEEKKAATQTKITESNVYDDGSHEVEVTKVINKNQKAEEKKAISRKVEVKTETKRKAVRGLPCVDRLQDEKKDCEGEIHPGYRPVFTYQNNTDCDWECSYVALPTEAPKAGTRKVVKKVVKKNQGGANGGGKGGAAAEKPKKECSGEKKIKFSNCLIKLNGLIAWGNKAKNFDRKFEKLLAKKKKKAPKKGGPKRKPGPKTKPGPQPMGKK